MGLDKILLWAVWIIGAIVIISTLISTIVLISISMKSSRFSQSESSSEEPSKISEKETKDIDTSMLLAVKETKRRRDVSSREVISDQVR